MVSPQLQRRFLLSLGLGVAVFFGLLVYGDFPEMAAALRRSAWGYLPLIFLLALGNYLLRFVRWQYYLHMLSLRVPLKQSITIFMSGLAMSITPGKFGELIKCYGLKQYAQTPFRQSAPIVFAERFTDLFSVILLAAFGSTAFRYGQNALLIALGAVVGMLVVVMHRPLAEAILRTLRRMPRLTRLADHGFDLYEHMQMLLRFRPLVVGLILGGLAWACECAGFFLVLLALHVPLTLGVATFIYAFATLFGAITFLPGGLGATEGSLTGLLILQHVDKSEATAAALVIRAATLWFAVAVGLLWFLPNQHRLAPTVEPSIS